MEKKCDVTRNTNITELLNRFMIDFFPKKLKENLVLRIRKSTDISIDAEYDCQNSLTWSLFPEFYKLAERYGFSSTELDKNQLMTILIKFLNHVDGLMLYESAEDRMKRIYGSNWRKYSYNALYPSIYIEAFIEFYVTLWDKVFVYNSDGKIESAGHREQIPDDKKNEYDSIKKLIDDYHYIMYARNSCDEERQYQARLIAEVILKKQLIIAADMCQNSDNNIVGAEIKIPFLQINDIYDSLDISKSERIIGASLSSSDGFKRNYIRNMFWAVFSELESLRSIYNIPFFSVINFNNINAGAWVWYTKDFSISQEKAASIIRSIDNGRVLCDKRGKVINTSSPENKTYSAYSALNIIKKYLCEYIHTHSITSTDETLKNVWDKIRKNGGWGKYNWPMDIEVSFNTTDFSDSQSEYLQALLDGINFKQSKKVQQDGNSITYSYNVCFLDLLETYLREEKILTSYNKPADSHKAFRLKPSTTKASLFKKYKIYKYKP